MPAHGKDKSDSKTKGLGKQAGCAAATTKDESGVASKSTGSKTSPAPVPKTVYRLFWKQEWDKLKSDDPNIQMIAASKQISATWKQMNDVAKDQYK